MSNDRKYSKSEELANALSHLAGAGLATAGLVLMIVFSVIRGDAWHIVTTSVFGATMLILYLSSGLAHALKTGRTKELFFTFDRIAIFLLIAGTYTPITLVVLKGFLGWTLFGLEWAMATAGIVLTFTSLGKSKTRVNYLFVILYVIMGWLLAVAAVPIIKSISLMGFVWIITGGICYSVGIIFYSRAKFLYHHLVWHLFVIAGSLSHFLAIFYHVIPSR
jgi:hemolysin III